MCFMVKAIDLYFRPLYHCRTETRKHDRRRGLGDNARDDYFDIHSHSPIPLSERDLTDLVETKDIS